MTRPRDVTILPTTTPTPSTADIDALRVRLNDTVSYHTTTTQPMQFNFKDKPDRTSSVVEVTSQHRTFCGRVAKLSLKLTWLVVRFNQFIAKPYLAVQTQRMVVSRSDITHFKCILVHGILYTDDRAMQQKWICLKHKLIWFSEFGKSPGLQSSSANTKMQKVCCATFLRTVSVSHLASSTVVKKRKFFIAYRFRPTQWSLSWPETSDSFSHSHKSRKTPGRKFKAIRCTVHTAHTHSTDIARTTVSLFHFCMPSHNG